MTTKSYVFDDDGTQVAVLDSPELVTEFVERDGYTVRELDR